MSEKCRLFYQYLSKRCRTVERAKVFYRKWSKTQSCGKFGSFTLRAMAHHISNVLEGKKHQTDSFLKTPYYETKYGTEIYMSLWENKEDKK